MRRMNLLQPFKLSSRAVRAHHFPAVLTSNSNMSLLLPINDYLKQDLTTLYKINLTSTTTTNDVSRNEESLHSRSSHPGRRRCRNNSVQRKAACTWLEHTELPNQLQRKKSSYHQSIHTNQHLPVRNLPTNCDQPSPSLRHSNRRLRPPELQHSPRKPDPATSRRRSLPHSADLHSRHISQ